VKVKLVPKHMETPKATKPSADIQYQTEPAPERLTFGPTTLQHLVDDEIGGSNSRDPRDSPPFKRSQLNSNGRGSPSPFDSPAKPLRSRKPRNSGVKKEIGEM